VLAIAAGLLLCLLLEGAAGGVSQTQAHAVLLGRGRPRPPGRYEHGMAILEGSSIGHSTRNSRVVGQARVAVAWGQEGLLTVVVLRLTLGLWLGLGRLRLGLVLTLALALGGLRG